MKAHLQAYWHGKSVVITGASSGLGWAITEALAPFSVNFCLLSRREDKMQELAAGLKASGSKFWVYKCDVRDREQVFTAMRNFHQETGHVDVAWVNSGISMDSSYEHWRWDAFEDMIDTNLKGAVYTARACLEIMVPQKSGAIVAIGSAASMRGLPTRGVYSLTKVGLDFYLQSKAVELPDIQFTMIHPGFVDTPINRGNPTRLFLLSAEKAAQIMIRAVARRKRFVLYPFRMGVLFRLIRAMPLWLFEGVARRTVAYSRSSEKQGRS